MARRQSAPEFLQNNISRQQTIFHGGPVRQQIGRDEIERQTETGSMVVLNARYHRRSSKLAWIVILPVYGADTIAEVCADLLIYEINYWFFKQF